MKRAALALALLACSEPTVHTSASSSLALDEAARTLWIASPDDDAVVAVELGALEERARHELGGAPSELALANGLLVVARSRSSSVALVELASGAVTDLPTPCGGLRSPVIAGELAILACPSDDRLVVVELGARRVSAVVRAAGRPSALAISGDRLAVTAARLGRVRVAPLDALTNGASLDEAAIDARDYAAGPGVAASGLDALAAGPSGFAALYQLVDHDSDRTRSPELGGYGAVLDERPRIAPRVAMDGCPGDYARFNGGVRVASGPSALAYSAVTETLWVVSRSTDNVLVLDCAMDGDGGAPVASAGFAPLRDAFRVGRGPRAIALTADGETAFVDLGFAHAVARLELGPKGASVDAPRDPALERRRELGPRRRYSVLAEEGRSAFFDATNTHLTPSGVVTCGTCHPEGGEDGLSWFLHTRHVGPKLRRTPPAWGAKRALSPLHWDGEFGDAETLSRGAIVELMEGDGLVVDVRAMAAFMEELEPVVPRPPADRDRAIAGRALFQAAGCAGCHVPPLFADGLAHAALPPGPDAGGALELVDTPSLRGLRARPPYFHDGRAATIAATLEAGAEHGVSLSAEERALLTDYLETL